MGLFGLFASRQEREAKRIRDLSKKAHEKYGDSATRYRALEGLREIGSPEAIAALLGRFTVRTEPQITDAEEKEATFRMVTGFGDEAIRPVLEFLEKQDQVSWALRCLEALVPEGKVIETLIELLERMSRQYVREPDKKVLFLHRLAEAVDPRIPAAALLYLEDPSDEVRIAALDVLVAQKDVDAGGAMATCLIDAEAPRVRAAAAGALADLGAPLVDRMEAITAKLPNGFRLGKDGVVRRT